jgi:predicted nucleotidyltransferase
MNSAITAFVEELAADATTRGVLLFGSRARGTARPDSDADLVIIVDQPGFVMGVGEHDGQEFELVKLSEATATAYFSENRDAAADTWSSAKILYDPDGSLARLRDHVSAMVAQGKHHRKAPAGTPHPSPGVRPVPLALARGVGAW